MLIDKEQIQKAKEKIGDNNADLIATMLNLEQYDPHNKKALCCFHKEDTPSFIYNSKSHSFHCFGCGVNVDIIDAAMHTGMSFIEAAKALFDTAGMKLPLGEHKVRDKADYRYPVPPPDIEPTQAFEYLAKRGISKETCEYAGIKQDEHGNIAFCYYDLNDVLKTVKYRPARKIQHGEAKCWCQAGADTEPLLFNMNRINPSEPLVCTEGEADTLALIESGIKNAVSIPFGCKDLHWIEHNWDFLEQFDSIILCGDNDPPGRDMVKEVTSRLGSWRVKVADLPTECILQNGKTISLKDANEVLFYLGKEALRKAIHNAKDTPVPSVVDFADIEDYNMDETDGIRIGLKEIDRKLLKLFYGTLTLISGLPSAGKTSFCYQMLANAIDQGVTCFAFGRELSDTLSKSWVNYILAGNRHISSTLDGATGSTLYTIDKDAKRQISEFYRGRLYFYRDDFPNDRDSLLNTMVDARRKFGCKVFLLDNLMTIDLKANSENHLERQTEFINDLIQFSVKWDACTILVAHPRKLLDQTADVGLLDVAGSSGIINLAHRAIGLRRVTQREKEGVKNKNGDWQVKPFPYDVSINIIKDRLRGATGAICGAYYDMSSRRFYSCPSEYDKNYRWDTTEYADKLPYPIHGEDEIFGSVM